MTPGQDEASANSSPLGFTNTEGRYRQSVAAFHNTIYLAQEQRDGFISATNESARFMDAGKSSFESSSYDGLWYNTDMQDTTRLAEEEEKDPEGEFQYHISQEVF